MSEIDELYEKGDRHRKELNNLFQITRATDERLCDSIRKVNARFANTSAIIQTVKDTAKGMAHEAAEASTRRIQVLEQNFEKGEGCALKLEVHVKQTTNGLRSINDQSIQHQNRIVQLENIVADLTRRWIELEAVPSRRCSSCAKVIRPKKASHLKCEDCYLTKRSRSCTICSSSYLPIHFSYKICPSCYLTKKAKQTKKQSS